MATIISYFCKFEQNYKISVVGPIPLGQAIFIQLLFKLNKLIIKKKFLKRMPKPKFPPIASAFTTLIGDAVNIAIVSFALNISLVKYFSNKHDYEVNSNQELLSYGMLTFIIYYLELKYKKLLPNILKGIGNLIISFFSGFPACSGLTRSLIGKHLWCSCFCVLCVCYSRSRTEKTKSTI